MRIAQVNSRHCHAQPVYGLDLVQAVSVVNNVWHTVSCCEYLTSVLKTPEDRVDEMKEAINRYNQGFFPLMFCWLFSRKNLVKAVLFEVEHLVSLERSLICIKIQYCTL